MICTNLDRNINQEDQQNTDIFAKLLYSYTSVYLKMQQIKNIDFQ